MEYTKPREYKNVSSGEMTRPTASAVNKLNKVILSREEFHDLLNNNDNIIVLKFGAEWCKPCNSIKSHVDNCISKIDKDITCLDLDVDDSFDLYAYLKSKKQVNGIPAILAYKKGNATFAPDASISGANLKHIEDFFNLINTF